MPLVSSQWYQVICNLSCQWYQVSCQMVSRCHANGIRCHAKWYQGVMPMVSSNLSCHWYQELTVYHLFLSYATTTLPNIKNTKTVPYTLNGISKISIHIYIYIFIFVYIYIYIYVYMMRQMSAGASSSLCRRTDRAYTKHFIGV